MKLDYSKQSKNVVDSRGKTIGTKASTRQKKKSFDDNFMTGPKPKAGRTTHKVNRLPKKKK